MVTTRTKSAPRNVSHANTAEEPIVRFKPEVERSMKRSIEGKDIIAAKDADDFFRQLGLR